uniref:transmembrane protein 120B-like isoform X2 n=1 Tax=Myxine glutinosa TaxID=7769 RepID=UPI00358E0587
MALNGCLTLWQELDEEYKGLQEAHRQYKQKLQEVTELQTSCSASIRCQKQKLQELWVHLRQYQTKASAEELATVNTLQQSIKERQAVFFDMDAFLPQKNSLYLGLVLGSINVTLLSRQAKFAYKDEYEKFKLYLTIILVVTSFACSFLVSYRVTDEIFNFLLVWYYCTLTIRESILITNGSRIKGWWVTHHYVSTFLSGVMLTWLCAISSILLPERLPVPAEGSRRKAQYGSHCCSGSCITPSRSSSWQGTLSARSGRSSSWPLLSSCSFWGISLQH